MKSKVPSRFVPRTPGAVAGLAISLLGISSIISGCADRDKKPASLDIAEQQHATDDDEWLREQRAVHVQWTSPFGFHDYEASALEVSVLAMQACYDAGSDWPGDSQCEADFNEARGYTCAARNLMAIATAQSDPIQLSAGVEDKWVFDRVTDANVARLATYAAEFARHAVGVSVRQLKTPSDDCRSTTTGLWTLDPSTLRPAALGFAAMSVEAYYLALGATERSVESTLNISDKARSSTPSAAQERQRAILGVEFSRATAAHMLVGGDDGLLGSTTQGYCLAQSLTPQGRAALQLLRDAAPPPSLLNNSDISVLLNSDQPNASCPECGGSVRQRLGKFYGLTAMQGVSGTFVESYYDLSLRNFTEARDYLRQEVAVFNRSPSARLDPSPDAAGYSRYAGTAGDRVLELPAGAWAARARHISARSPWYDPYACVHFIDPHGPVSDVGFYEYSARPAPLETLIAGMHGAARDIVRSTDNFAGAAGTPVPSPESNEVRGILASVLTSGDYKGTVELYANDSFISSFAHGYRASDKVRIMVGEDGLRCATEKAIEGAPCDDALTGAQYNVPLPAACTAKPATFSCLTAQVLTGDVTANFYGTDGYTGGTGRSGFLAGPTLSTDKTRLYFVKLKDPNLPEAPGNYELLGGAPLLLNEWTAVPVIPSLNARLASILAPNRKNCAVPRVNCMGKDYDARLPLEDELTSDGDNVENSWKHYLDLARQAANEADLLGREFRDAKLNKLQGLALEAQRRQEQLQASDAALDELQALCGTAIDNRKLLEYFSGSDGTTNLDFMITPGSCSATTPCTGDAVCTAGKCIKSPDRLTAPGSPLANDPDAQRLVDCLATGPASVQRFVTLGSQELCVYTTTGRPNDVVCPSTLPAGTTCPVPKPSTGCPNPGAGFDTSITKVLGYFSTPSNGGSSGATNNICTTFRKARKSRTEAWTGTDGLATALAQVANSVVFLPGRLSDTVGRPGFVAKYGGHFDVTEDGAPRWSSGNIVQGRTSTEWPHKLPSDCVAGVHDGLFCTTWPTAPTNAQIVDLNRRVFEATLAASAIRGSMDSAKLGLDVVYPHPNPWPTTPPTTTTLYLNSVPILRESKSAVLEKGKRGFATAYTWLQPPPETAAWIAPDGTALSPSGLYFYGPLDASDAQFTGLSFQPTLIDPYRGNRGLHGFRWVVETLSGQHNEDQGNAIKLNNHEGVVLRNLRPGQPLGGGDNFISTRALLDGFEMLCELDRSHNAANVKPASLSADQWTLSDMSQASAFLKSVADTLESNASRAIFANVPTTAAVALNDAPPSGGLSAIGGEMGRAISDLRAGFIEVKEAMPVITSQLQQMSSQVETLKAQLDTVEASKDINELQAWSTSMNSITDCAASLNATAILSFGLNQAAKCANAMAQTAIALKRATLEDRIQDNTATIARQQFAEAMAQHAETMQVAALRLETAIERISGVLTAIDGSRMQAARALAKSLYLASYQSASQRTYDSAVGALSDLAQTRYIRATKNAKVMSFFARRAIEQRLGIDLTEMKDDLPLVDAPQSWEGEVCTLSGIQPEAGTSPDAQATASGDWIATYGDGFIGDYVDKLEKVVESYRLTNNFHEGRDVAVVSLRDDIANVRTDCLQPSRNLLKDSADLSRWTGMNCNPASVGGVTYSGLNCVQALRTPDYIPTTMPVSTQKIADLAVKGLRGAESGAPGFKLQFGDGGTCAAGNGGCFWKNGSALSQVVNLSPGKYRLSWYTRDTLACTATAQCASGFTCTNNLCLPNYTNGASASIVVVRGYTNGTVTTPNPAAPSGFVAPQADRSAGPRWMRASIEFSITVAGDYEIGFGVSQATMPTAAQEVTIGAPMLETLPPNGTPTMMTSFQPTDSAGLTPLTACEDTDGVRFRREHWSRQCVHLCDDGFTGNCQKGPEYCYQEFTFGVAQPWIATGKLFKYSGFARGNFNYRIDSLALNFVGSKTRDCSGSTLPSTCYNGGFIPYSIAHGGPFFIRNQTGEDVEAMLFDGKIEHARGLALERYITNPISSTDRELLADYMRSEFAGRPLDGTFTIRMWEEPGVDLESVDDIQLILNYRYWTGFD